MNGLAALLRRRWPALALAVSLVLNGFLIGMFVADSVRHARRTFSGERFARIELRRIDDHLPKEAVDRIAQELAPVGPEIDRRLERMRAIRAEVMQLAAAPEPDRAALDEKLAELRAEAAAMQQVVQQTTYDALLRLSPADRAGLAEAAKKR